MTEKYKFKPFIMFFTGISASGKSTICFNLKKKFKKLGFKKVKNIDGDYFRKKNFKILIIKIFLEIKLEIIKFPLPENFLKINILF